MVRVPAVLVIALLTACSAREPAQAKPKGKVEMVAGPADGDVADWVAKSRHELSAKGRTVLVYEGATWCEPCQQLHAAVEAGKLDEQFPTLTLLEFDADRDGERLAMAGYMSNFIPYFAAPGDDGRATGKEMQGGVKGDGALDSITKRLSSLVPAQ